MPSTPTFNPGLLNRNIELWYPVVVRNSINEAVEGFVKAVPNVWTRWTIDGSEEFYAGDSKNAQQSGVFRIRYRPDLDARWRIVWEQRVYELSGPPEEVGYKHLLDLPVKLSLDQELAVNTGTPSSNPQSQAFQVALAEGDETKAVVFPTAFFGAAPEGLAVSVLAPTGGYAIQAVIEWESITNTGFNVSLGATVPGVGYKLSIIAIK